MKKLVKDKFEKRSTELLIITALLVIGAVGVTASSSNILDAGAGSSEGLIAEYRFDTGAGDTAYDTSGDNDGTINGASWTSGLRGKALSFDGSDDYVDSGESFNYDNITISAWVYRDKLSGWRGITSNGDFGNNEIWFGQKNDQSKAFIEYTDQSGNHRGISTPSGTLPIGEWKHLVGKWNGKKLKIYIDGKLEAESGDLSSSPPASPSGGFHVGNVVGSGRSWDGKIDELTVYSQSLEQSEINSIYNSGSWRIGTTTEEDDPDKVAEFSFQHQNSSHVLDTSGYNNHGEKMNGVSQEAAVDCKVGRCFSFDGSDDYTEISNPPDVSSDSEDFTVMFWMKPDSGGSSKPVVEWNNGAHIWQHSSEDNFWLNPSGDCSSIEINGAVKLDKWSHYTATYDSSANEFRIYSDGRLLETNSQNCSADTSSSDLFLGHRDGDNRYFDGRLDQVKIFNRSLSQSEIIEETEGLQGGGTVLDLRFNRDGGDKVHEYSGEDNHGTLQPNESAGPERVDGLDGNAMKFDGSDDYVDISSSNSAYDSDATTVMAWVKPNNGGWIAGDGARHRLHIDGNDATWWIKNNNNGNSNQISGGNPELNEWNLVVGTYDSDTGEQNLYLNGESVASANPNIGFVSGHDNQIVGGSYGNNADYKGVIDNLKFYAYTVSESKVQELYSSGKSKVGKANSSSSTNLQDGLVLSQSFDRVETCGQSDTVSCPSGVSGEVAVDESGEANHGELVNGPTKKGAEDCKVGSCLEFDGNNDFVGVEDDFSLDIGNSDLTASTWVKVSEDYSPSNHRIILEKAVDEHFHTTDGPGWGISIDANRNIYGGVTDSTGNDKWETDKLTDIRDGNWHHVVLNIQNGDSLSLYLDGEKESSVSLPSIDQNNSVQLGIGASANSNTRNIEALIDDSRFYDRSLSDQEIWKLYTHGRDRESGMAGAVGRWDFSTGKVGTEDNPAKGCKQISDLRPSASSGEYWINPDGATGVDKFKVYCEMSENGGGWIKLRIANDDDANNMFWFSKYGTVTQQEDVHGKIGNQFDWSKLNHLSSQSQLDEDWEFVIAADTRTNVPINWHQYGDTSNTYTDEQMSAIRGQVDSISSTTEAFAHTNDDDGCSQNGEVDLKKKSGGKEYRITHFTSGNQESAYAVETEEEMNNYNDVGFLIPSYADFRNDGTCSGEADHASFGYEKNYTLVRTDKNYRITDSSSDNKGTINGNPKWTEGKTGSALEFDGDDDYIKTPVSGDLASDPYTLTAWFYADSIGQNTIVGNYDGSGMLARLESGDDYDLWHNSGSVEGGEVTLNKWTHIAYIYDGSNGYIYENGKQVASGSLGDGSHTSDLRIGDSYDDRQFDGKLDDVRIYPYALNKEQVKQVMNSGAVSVG